MADITNLRFAQSLKRALGLKAIDPGRVISPVVTGVHIIGDPGYAPEHRGDRGERLLTYGVFQAVLAGASGFGMLQVVAPANGRAVVVKRMTVSAQIPTAANQPGNLAVVAGHNITTNPQNVGTVAFPRDSRLLGSGGSSSGFANPNQAAASMAIMATTCAWGITITPQAAVIPNFNVSVDNLDLVLMPGSGSLFGIRGDTNAVAGWNYFITVEGYEFSPDAAELLQLPP